MRRMVKVTQNCKKKKRREQVYSFLEEKKDKHRSQMTW
jgi:hypothetical protein